MLAVALASVGLTFAVPDDARSAAGAATPAGVSFADEFDGTTLDASKWSRCYYWRTSDCTNEWNNELQVYRDGNVTVADGKLNLTARPESATGYLQNGTPKQFDYSSGMISSEGRFAFQYGYVEIRAKVAKGQGLWPALWMLPADRTWPPEIDIMEYIGSQPDRVYMTNHPSDGSARQWFAYVGPDFSQDWHTFAIDWRPGSLRFLVDGVERGRVTDNVPAEQMYLLANMAVGGAWPGSPDASTPFPADFGIDYVRVTPYGETSGSWKAEQPVTTVAPTTTAAPATTAPPTTTAPAPTTAPPTTTAPPATTAPPTTAPPATTAPPTTAPPAAESGLATLIDDFSSSAVDPERWPDVRGTARSSAGRLVIDSRPGYGHIRSAGRRSLVGQYVQVEVPAVASGKTSETFLSVDAPGGNQLSIIKSGNNLLFRSVVEGKITNPGAFKYDAKKHRWWRIQESGGIVRWETSSDGQRWTTHRSVPVPFDLTSVSATLRAGHWGSESAPRPAVFDNFNRGR